MPVETISDRLWRTSNDAHAERVVRLPDGRRARATIRRNFYDHQCTANAAVWTDAGWTQVLARDISELPAAAVSGSHAADTDQDRMAASLNLLIDAAATILDPKDTR
jgi:hypothetical protein